MTTIKIYCNKKNHNKFLEIHNDGYRHNTVRQYMEWGQVKNFTGDRKLHRWRKGNLNVLLEDYEEVKYENRMVF